MQFGLTNAPAVFHTPAVSWTEEAEAAFLRLLYCSLPHLFYHTQIHPGISWWRWTCWTQIGAVLSQRSPGDEKLHPFQPPLDSRRAEL